MWGWGDQTAWGWVGAEGGGRSADGGGGGSVCAGGVERAVYGWVVVETGEGEAAGSPQVPVGCCGSLEKAGGDGGQTE